MAAPVPIKEARVVDTNGKELPDGEIGELAVRGEPMMLGYCKRPETTAEVMRDGWFHTDDLVSDAEKGNFKVSISSAKKDLTEIGWDV